MHLVGKLVRVVKPIPGLGHEVVLNQIGTVVKEEDLQLWLVYFESMQGYSVFHEREFVPVIQ